MAIALTLGLAGCVAPAVPQSVQPLRVAGFGYADGMAARRAGEAECATAHKRLVTGIYDRFDGDAWVFQGGCQ